MDRNRHGTVANTLPTITTSTNVPGYFTKGDPSHGISATVPTADWANGITEELVNTIQENGQVLSISDNKQLVKAISSIAKRKNWIINGDFDVWQYGTVANNPQGYCTADRWICSTVNTQMTVAQDQMYWADTDGLTHPMHMMQVTVNQASGALDHCFIAQIIEHAANLSGKTVTLSFWAKADGNKNLGVEIGQFFGTGGAPSPSVRKAIGGQVQLTNTFKKFSFTGTLPSIEGKTVGANYNDGTGVVFYFDAGNDTELAARTSNIGHQSGNFWIARVQLEYGTLASDFENNHPAVETAICERYYYRGKPVDALVGAVHGAGTKKSHLVNFPTTMRAIPTISINTAGATMVNISDAVVQNASTSGCNIVLTATTTAGDSLFQFAQGGYITANCELPIS
jgi:hypothetical protein